MVKRGWSALAGLGLFLSFQVSATKMISILGGIAIPLDEAPVVQNDQAVTTEDVPIFIDVLANDSDEDGVNTVTIEILSQKDKGAFGNSSLSVVDNSINYQAPSNWYGTASDQDWFEYRITDINGNVSEIARVDVAVEAVNDEPTLNVSAPYINQRFNQGDTIAASAMASDVDGSIALVRFRVNGGSWKNDADSPYEASFSVAGDGLSAGNNTVEFQAMDNEGGVSAVSGKNIIINTLPAITVSSPSDNSLYLSNQSVTASVSAEDSDGSVSKVVASLDNGAWIEDVSAPYSFNFGVLTQGSHNIRLRALDNSGEYSSIVSRTVLVNAIPAVSPTTPEDAQTLLLTANLVASASATDSNGSIAAVEFRLNNGTWQTDTTSPYSHDFGLLSNGEHDIDYRAKDNQGEYSSVVSRTVTVNTLPVVSPTLPASNDTILSTANLVAEASATDSNGAVSAVEFRLNNGSWQVDTHSPYRHDFGVQVSGSYIVEYRAKDNVGEYSPVISRTVTVNTLPSVTPSLPANDDTILSTAGLVATAAATDANDTVSAVEFKLNNGSWMVDNSAPYSHDFGVQGSGQYQVYYRAVDGKGEYSTTLSRSVSVNSRPTLSGSPATSATAGQQYQFSPVAADADGDNLTFSLSGHPSWLGVNPATGVVSGTPTESQVGNYSGMVVSVSDGAESASLPAFHINVAGGNTAPTISGTAPTNVTVGQQYVFTPGAQDADGDSLLFTIVNRPSWAGFNSSTGTLSGTPEETDQGTYENIVISVSDGQGSDALPAFSITVSVDNSWLYHDGTVLDNIPDDSSYDSSEPVLTQHLVGELKGQAAVDGGAFNYSLPISLPPGINGQAPSVSLSYSSQGGNGIAGYGWSLSAGSSVSRCASIYAIDGKVQNVLRTDADNLCLNGQRLINTNNSHGNSGALYKTERDSGVIVELTDAHFSDSGSKFIVHKPNGGFDEYHTPFVPLNAGSESPDTPLSWHISTSSDAWGNEITYTYSNADGEITLTDMHYTGRHGVQGDRQVKFVYETGAHVETRNSYGYGYQTRQTRRLKAIEIHIAGTLSDTYNLNYNPVNTADGDMPTLGSVDHVLSSGTLSVDFAYNGRQLVTGQTDKFFEPLTEHAVNENTFGLIYQPYQVLGDYDGDGFPELKVSEYGPDNQWTIKFRMSSTGNDISPSIMNELPDYAGFQALYNCDPTDPEESDFCALYGFDIQANLFTGEMDANFDGKQDFVFVNSDFKVAFGTYTPDDETIVALPDTNIDATCQIARASTNAGILNCQSYVMDINQDGRSDLLVATGETGAPVTTAWIRDDDGVGFTQYNSINKWFLNFQIMDIDGDGQQELVNTTNQDPIHWKWYDIGFDGTTVTYTPEVFPFTLNAAARGDHIIDRNGYKRGVHSFWMDTNGDGLKDLVALHDEDITDPDPLALGYIPEVLNWYVSFNMGGGKFAPLEQMTFPNQNPVEEALSSNNNADNATGKGSLAAYMKVFDFNGDGREDFLVPASDQVQYECIYYETDSPNVPKTCPTDSGDTEGWDLRHHKRDIWTWKIWVANDSGTGFTEILLDDSILGALSTTGFADVDRDGKPDIVTNVGFNASASWRYYDPTKINTADIPFSGERIYYRNGDEFKRHLMSGVTTTMGEALVVDYHPLGRDMHLADGIYDVNHLNSSFPYINFGSSMVVVKSLATNNGLETVVAGETVNAMNQQNYHYADARFHLQGRGFQGFGNITIEHVAAGTTSSTDYYQDFPLTGQVKQQENRRTTDDYLLSRTTTGTLYQSPNNKGIYCAYPGRQTRETFDLENNYVVTSTVTEQRLDDNCLTEWQKTTVHDFDLQEREPLPGEAADGTYYEDNSSVWITHSTEVDTLRESAEYAANGSMLQRAAWRKTAETHTVTVTYGGNRHGDLLPAQPQRKTTTTYDYGTTDVDGKKSMLPGTVTTQSGADSGLFHAQDIEYDAYGHVFKVTHRGTHLAQSRWQQTTRDSTGYFVTTTQNSEWGPTVNVTELSDYNLRYGLPGKSKDANGVVTTTTYNALGLPTKVAVRLGETDQQPAPDVYTQYQWCNSNICPESARFSVAQIQQGTPASTAFTDSLGRNVGSRVETFNGGTTQSSHQFDALGRLLVTEEHSGATTTYAEYDILGRPGKKTEDRHPLGYTSAYSYSLLQTDIEVTGARTLSMSRTYNSRKQLMRTVDAMGEDMLYAYDGMGNPTMIEDVMGNHIHATYNDFGQKTHVSDPNQGDTWFQYNGMGELIMQVDANRTITKLHYDQLGRVISKSQGEKGASSSNTSSDVSTWSFDTITIHNADTATWSYDSEFYGAVDVEARGDHSRAYFYDDFGRPQQQWDNMTDAPAKTFIQKWKYDTNYGRLTAHQHAADTGDEPLVVAYTYDSRGFKLSDYIPNANGSGVPETLNTYQQYSDTGLPTKRQFGNDVVQNITYHAASGMVSNIQTTDAVHQDISYLYDGYGNLTNINNSIDGINKDYTYDDLHRLISADVTIGNISNNLTGTITYQYNAAGNLTGKSDYGSQYQYGNTSRTDGNAGPNALRQLQKDGETINYQYDQAGNLTTGHHLDITYDGNHHTKTIQKEDDEGNLTSLTFWYDASGQRYRQVKTTNGTTTTTWYVGSTEFVKEEGAKQSETTRMYIGDHTVINRLESGSSNELQLTHTLRDRLGSVSVVMDGSRTTGDRSWERRDYDAFGKPIQLPSAILPPQMRSTNRGFTDHEHLLEVELIHMNGRAYDYNTGRFLSVDPFIQSPANSQSVNPYSYIMNNPLSGIDPTGYTSRCVGDVDTCPPVNNDGKPPAEICIGGGCHRDDDSDGSGEGNGEDGSGNAGSSKGNTTPETSNGDGNDDHSDRVEKAFSQLEWSLKHDPFVRSDNPEYFQVFETAQAPVSSDNNISTDFVSELNLAIGMAGVAASMTEVSKVDWLPPKGNTILHSNPQLNSVNLGQAKPGQRSLFSFKNLGHALAAPLAGAAAVVSSFQSLTGIRGAKTENERLSHVIKGAADLTIIATSFALGGLPGLGLAFGYLALDYVFDFRGGIESHLNSVYGNRRSLRGRGRANAK